MESGDPFLGTVMAKLSLVGWEDDAKTTEVQKAKAFGKAIGENAMAAVAKP